MVAQDGPLTVVVGRPPLSANQVTGDLELLRDEDLVDKATSKLPRGNKVLSREAYEPGLIDIPQEGAPGSSITVVADTVEVLVEVSGDDQRD